MATLRSILLAIVGAFFIVSGLGKLFDSLSFTMLLFNYGFSFFYNNIYFAFIASWIPTLEIILGAALLIQYKPKLTVGISTILLVLFTLAFANGYFVNGIEDCGCFGSFQFLKTSPMVSFLRNFILIGINVYLFLSFRQIPEQEDNFATKKLMLLALIGIIAFPVGGYSLAQPLHASDSLAGASINDTKISRLIPENAPKKYLVFLFSFSCTHCWDAAKNVQDYKDRGFVDEIYGFGVGHPNLMNRFADMFNTDYPLDTINTETLLQATETTPTVWVVKDGIITKVMKGHVQSGFTLERMHADAL